MIQGELQTPRESISLYEQALIGLRNQLWASILIFIIIALVNTRLVRYLAGVESTPMAIAIQVIVYTIAILGLLLRNSRHAPIMQTLFLVCMHVLVPIVTLFYGGIRGFGDIALLGAIVLSGVYGWRRWMFVTFTIGVSSLLYALFLEILGQPLQPFLEETARFASVKLLFLLGLISVILLIGYRFYSRLLKQHQVLADEQLRLAADLKQSTEQLTRLSADLALSRQNIVTTREEERRRLRRNLLEQIGPTLASLSYRAGAARNAIQRQPQETDDNLNALEHNIKNTLSDVRKFVYGLYPPLLDQLGLAGALEQYFNNLKGNVSAELRATNVPDEMSAAVEIVVYRLVQRALGLIETQPVEARVNLTCEDGVILVAICLNDQLPLHVVENHPQMQAVFERIDELTGTIELDPQNTEGFKILTVIPL